MKKIIIIAMALVFVLGACGVKEEEHNALKSELVKIKSENASLKKRMGELEKKLADIKKKIQETKTETEKLLK